MLFLRNKSLGGGSWGRVHLSLPRELLFRRRIQLIKTSYVIEPPQDFFVHFVYALFLQTQVLARHDRRGEQVVAQRIGAVFLDYLHRIGIIFEPLGHLLPVACQNKPVDDDVIVRRAAEQNDAKHNQRVKPPARLVESLGDKVGG